MPPAERKAPFKTEAVFVFGVRGFSECFLEIAGDLAEGGRQGTEVLPGCGGRKALRRGAARWGSRWGSRWVRGGCRVLIRRGEHAPEGLGQGPEFAGSRSAEHGVLREWCGCGGGLDGSARSLWQGVYALGTGSQGPRERHKKRKKKQKEDDDLGGTRWGMGEPDGDALSESRGSGAMLPECCGLLRCCGPFSDRSPGADLIAFWHAAYPPHSSLRRSWGKARKKLREFSGERS